MPRKRRIPEHEAVAIAERDTWRKLAEDRGARVEALEKLVALHKRFVAVIAAQRDCAGNASPATAMMLHEQLVTIGNELEQAQRAAFPDVYERDEAREATTDPEQPPAKGTVSWN